MHHVSLITALVSLVLLISPASAAGPYANGRFQGRIAYSADGNHNDPDDWAASPVALAIFAEAGLKDRLVHFDYNCILPKTDPEWEKIHAESVLGTAERYGYDRQLFHDCHKDVDAAVASIARAIDVSSADNPLYFIVAGPMEVPCLGIQKSQPDKRQHVYCISHSRWNDGFANMYTFTHTKRSVIESGVNWVQIRDQNRLLSKSPYGQPAKLDSQWQPYHWMRDSSDAKVKWLWERLQVSTRPDPSDAGMAYFLATGDEDADPEKLRKLLDDQVAPQPLAARKQVRLEAENFRTAVGFEIEDKNDRTASHRLCMKLMKGDGVLRTPLAEPYAPTQGRFDVEIRYADESGAPSRMALLINGQTQAGAWQSAAQGQGWQSHTIEGVEIRAGDEIALQVHGPPRPPRLPPTQPEIVGHLRERNACSRPRTANRLFRAMRFVHLAVSGLPNGPSLSQPPPPFTATCDNRARHISLDRIDFQRPLWTKSNQSANNFIASHPLIVYTCVK